MFDLPIAQKLRDSKRVLLMGAGGGYDILGAVPLFSALRAAGKTVHLAGVSFSPLARLQGCTAEREHPTLFAVEARAAVRDAYCPEAWLAKWALERHGSTEPVWGLAKTGVRPLRAALAHLVDRLGLDTVVLVDGGVDLILRGDETAIGTPAEDLASLRAVRGLPVESFVMCLGFGAEMREGIPHAQVLERIAEMERAGGYLGAISLSRSGAAGATYLDALAFVREGQADQRGTHIHHVVQSSMAGEFGGEEPDVWRSPLSAIAWFFSLRTVADSHAFAPRLDETESIWDVTVIIRACRQSLPIRDRTRIPL